MMSMSMASLSSLLFVKNVNVTRQMSVFFCQIDEQKIVIFVS